MDIGKYYANKVVDYSVIDMRLIIYQKLYIQYNSLIRLALIFRKEFFD